MLKKDAFEEYFRTRDIELRNKIVEEYLYMVDVLVRRYLGKGVDKEDLYQAASMALILAVDRFDPTKGFEFSSFATPTILGEIKKYFRDNGWSTKVPRRMKEIAIKIPSAKDELTAKLKRVPTVPELAEYLNVSEESLLKAMESGMAYRAVSIDEPFSDDEENSQRPMLEKFMSQEEKGYKNVEDREIIDDIYNQLSDTNKFIFKKRFIEEMSQGEIADELGVSQMTISRAEKKIRERFVDELKRS